MSCATYPQACDENLQSHRRHEHRCPWWNAREKIYSLFPWLCFLESEDGFSRKTGPSLLFHFFLLGSHSTFFSLSAPCGLVLST